jgi:uncharacterized repeat protein (TIGR03803 family)
VNCVGTTGGGCGAVFSLNAKGALKVIYAFEGGADGNEPTSPLLEIGGVFYGVTAKGGTGCAGAGCGTVFSVTPDGVETVLYRFPGGSDGANPSGH